MLPAGAVARTHQRTKSRKRKVAGTDRLVLG
jgi:hypothetical protein